MYLEAALSEEDDYVRLQKLSLGIKEIASMIPNIETFNDTYILKLLLCSYPFQQNSVELLISILFDRFKDVKFLSAFHQACTDLALLQEQRTLLSQRSLSLKSSRITNSLNLTMEQRKNSSNQQFSKAVIAKLLVAKKFSVQYLKPLFSLGNDLNQDLEKLARIFKIYIINTKDQQFIYKIISIFDECKSDIFGNRQWVTVYYEEIDQCNFFKSISIVFLQNHISIPNEKREISSNTKVTFEIDNKKQVLEFESQDSSEENTDIDLQKWLCESETFDILEQEILFSNSENFEEFLKFILQPEKVELSRCWNEKYKNTPFESDHYTYYKVIDKKMKPEETIRSFKALQVLLKEENIAPLSLLLPQYFLHIFNGIYDSVTDQYHNANLNHLAFLLENLLKQKPKLSAVQFVELNLFFSLSVYMYNPLISSILENLVNLTVDKYQFGCFFQEQLWKYLCKTEWFKFIAQLISGESFNQKMIDKITKCEGTISILSVLKTLSQYDKQYILIPQIDMNEKQQLTNYLGMLQPGKSSEAYYTTNQLNWHLNSDIYEYISTGQINEKDIDNLTNFVADRNTNVLIKKYFHEMKHIKSKKVINDNDDIINSPKQDQEIVEKQQQHYLICEGNKIQKNRIAKPILSNRKSQTKLIQKFAQYNSLQSSPTVIQYSPGLQVLTSIEREDTVDEQNTVFRRQQQKSSFLYHNSKFRHRTEDSNTNEGFSSSRLKTIYPSYKTSINNTDYEKQLENFKRDQKYFKEGINILQSATKSHIEFLKSNNENVKQTLNRLDLSSICSNFLSEAQFNTYFQIYLYDILENKQFSDDTGDECGIFINFIIENVIEMNQLVESRIAIGNSFAKALEYFCKIIFLTHKNPNFLIAVKHKFKKTLLMQTLSSGFQLLLINDKNKASTMIVKYLNESVLHILIIWFFDSDQNNQFQRNFLLFMNLFMNVAPQALISSLFFKIGLISSLQNAYSRLFVNGMKNAGNYENLYCYIHLLIQTILSVIRKRQLAQLEAHLGSMESWHILTNNKSFNEPKLISNINESMQRKLKHLDITSRTVTSITTTSRSFHKLEDEATKKQSQDILLQRKSVLLGPRLTPISPSKILKSSHIIK